MNHPRIMIPTMKHRPVCLIAFKPNQITTDVRSNVIKTVLSIIDANQINKKTFDRISHFSKDERLLYIPEIKNTRKFLKFQLEKDWLLEKPQMTIDSTVGIIDTLVHKNYIIIRLLTNVSLQNKDFKLMSIIAKTLSSNGSAYVFYHDKKNQNSGNEYEHFIEYSRQLKQSEYTPLNCNGIRVFDKVLQVHSLSIRDIVEELDMGVEVLCAPYDIQEYTERLTELKHQKSEGINNIQLSDDESDIIGEELDNEINILETLIERINEMVVYKKISIDTIYFKMSQSAYNNLKNL